MRRTRAASPDVARTPRFPLASAAVALLLAIALSATAGCNCEKQYEDYEPYAYRFGNVHEHIKSRRQLLKLLAFMDRNHIWWSVIAAASDKTNMNPDGDFISYSENNELVLELAADHPKRLIPFVTFDPDYEKKDRRIESYIDRGARGIILYHGHSDFYKKRLDSKDMLGIYDLAGRAGVPIMLHVNTHDRRLLEQLESILKRMKRVDFICSHLCMSMTRLPVLERLLKDHPNLYVDMTLGGEKLMEEAFLFLTLDEKRRKRLTKIIEKNPDRFLFGTDLIVTDHPQKNHAWLDLMSRGYMGWLMAPRFEHGFPKRATYEGLALSEETRKMVLSTNFRRVILGEEDPGSALEGEEDEEDRIADNLPTTLTVDGEPVSCDDLGGLPVIDLRIYGCAGKIPDDDDDDDDDDDFGDDDDDDGDDDDDDDDWDDDDDE